MPEEKKDEPEDGSFYDSEFESFEEELEEEVEAEKPVPIKDEEI